MQEDDHRQARILIIRLGALGDLTLCAPAFQAIRAAHPRAQLALLTQPAWADFAYSMPWFDFVIRDTRPRGAIGDWLDLRRRVADFGPTRVYDLQGKQRQGILFWLLGGPWGGIEWSGAVPYGSHPRVWPPRPGWHFADFIAAQLQAAGVAMPDTADWSWLDAPVDEFNLPKIFALLIPGCAPTRPDKRWPASSYAAVARGLMARGIAAVAIGGKGDMDAIAAIKAEAPGLIDLGGCTSLLQIGGIARRAALVLGNDTGPSHIAAAVGAPSLTLFSENVNPVWSRPRGPKTAFLQGKPLADLPVAEVQAALRQFGV